MRQQRPILWLADHIRLCNAEGPLEDAKLCARLTQTPAGAAIRRWTLNDDRGEHHGVVDSAESPLVLDLRWRRSSGAATSQVGVFRLDLRGLLKTGCIRTEPTQGVGKVRLRIAKRMDGAFWVQARNGGPSVALKA